MSVTHVGSTKKFAENWDKIFAGKQAKEKPAKAEKRAKAKTKTQAVGADKAKGKTRALATAATTSANGRKPALKAKKRAMHADEPVAAIKLNREKSAKKAPAAKDKATAKKRKAVLLQRELF